MYYIYNYYIIDIGPLPPYQHSTFSKEKVIGCILKSLNEVIVYAMCVGMK